MSHQRIPYGHVVELATSVAADAPLRDANAHGGAFGTARLAGAQLVRHLRRLGRPFPANRLKQPDPSIIHQ